MEWMDAEQAAEKWGISVRSVRNYCREGRITGVRMEKGHWLLPETAAKPPRKKRREKKMSGLLSRLREEKAAGIQGGIYHRIQIDLTYNSNHIEGSRLTHDQTRYIYETHTIEPETDAVKVDDIVETVNHFHCIDVIIDTAEKPVTQGLVKELHRILKTGTTDARKKWFAVGAYKKLPNEVGGMATAKPEEVAEKIGDLLKRYNRLQSPTLDELLQFHYEFERIHPFQDGNGRVGRLLLFKECLHWKIVPFIITENLKFYYYRGLKEWQKEPGYLRDTCLLAQDCFKAVLDYFKISYS